MKYCYCRDKRIIKALWLLYEQLLLLMLSLVTVF